MYTVNEISSTKLLLILSGLLGVFLFCLSYPLKLHAQLTQKNVELKNTQTNATPKSQLQEKILRVRQSAQAKNATIVYLKQALLKKSKERLLSAQEIKALNIANQNFKIHSQELEQRQLAYLNYLEGLSSNTSLDDLKIETFKKNIYKQQQRVYYSFWETYNLMQ